MLVEGLRTDIAVAIRALPPSLPPSLPLFLLTVGKTTSKFLPRGSYWEGNPSSFK